MERAAPAMGHIPSTGAVLSSLEERGGRASLQAPGCSGLWVEGAVTPAFSGCGLERVFPSQGREDCE